MINVPPKNNSYEEIDNAKSTPYFSNDDQETLVRKYAPLVKFLANRISMRVPPNVSLDDLISCGTMGLLDAITKFDPSKNVKFKTYAEVRIRGAILDGLRNLDWIPRSIRKKIHEMEKCINKLERSLGHPPQDEEIAKAMEVDLDGYYAILNHSKSVDLLSLDEPLKEADQSESKDTFINYIADETTPMSETMFAEMKSVVSEAIKKLTQKEQSVIAMYYNEGLTLKEIGEVLGLTESRISQIHTQCVIKLRTKLKSYFQ